MSGHSARIGFHFQDLYLLFRVLRDASDSLEHAWQAAGLDVLQILDNKGVRYGIEASPRGPNAVCGGEESGTDWDVLVLAENKLEFAEVKSGAISKTDREALWRRLRRELVNAPRDPTSIVPVLVVDPETAGSLSKWRELAGLASQGSGPVPSTRPSDDVRTAAQLLGEALWCMCGPDTSRNMDEPPVPVTAARSALSRFELRCYDRQQLDLDVSQMRELLFPGGLAETEQSLLLGWLSRRATAPAPGRRLFTVRELLAEIGILKYAASLTAGTLKEWRDLWNEAPQGVRARTRLELGEAGQSVPAAEAQPDALAALTGGESRSLVILGAGGAGKSTLLVQVAEKAQQSGEAEVVMHCGADDVTVEELERLLKAFRFRAALAAIKNPSRRACLFVDGLDEADAPLRKRWAQLLLRLTTLPNVFMAVSVRDAVWRGDGKLRDALKGWTQVTLALWPEEVVRKLLSGTEYCDALPQSVTDLLRTPIMLDLFWRAFVEGHHHDVLISLPAAHQARPAVGLLGTEADPFAPPRLSPQLHSRLTGFLSQAVRHIGPFPETGLDVGIVQILLSEGIIVREGRLQPRLRFRHPLLREFAIGQWCLATDNDTEVAYRWHSIHGGLNCYGALRAVSEALLDRNAGAEHPHLELGGVIRSIIQTDSARANQVAQVLGTHPPSDELDPAAWPAEVQSSLPRQFGRDLLLAAKLERNGSWAARVERWPEEAQWLGDECAKEVWRFACTLVEELKLHPTDGELGQQCQRIGRTLRRISEVERFAGEFGQCNRWLKMQAIVLVVPLLPDEATLAWVEREMAQASWRTRSSVLEVLIHLVPVNAERAAAVYRSAVGLLESSGRHILAAPLRGGIIDHQVIEWSLAGEGGRHSLLKERPKAFLPVALELAEALWHSQQEQRGSRPSGMWKVIRRFGPSWSAEAQAERERQSQERLGGLVDDVPRWTYWQGWPGHDARERCLRAIHECVKECARGPEREFALAIFTILRGSPLASIHSILLDVLLEQGEKPWALDCILTCIADSRLFHVPGIEVLAGAGPRRLLASRPTRTPVSGPGHHKGPPGHAGRGTLRRKSPSEDSSRQSPGQPARPPPG